MGIRTTGHNRGETRALDGFRTTIAGAGRAGFIESIVETR